MSHPRAVFPPEVIPHYQQHGAVKTRIAYRCQWGTLRRWLVEHGVQIRPQGLRIGRKLQETKS